MNRITNDQMMMGIALEAAKRSTCSRLHVGAVIADGPHPISIGYNGAGKGEPHCEHTTDEPCTVALHAESNALDFARVPVAGMSMYITHLPCFACAGRLINSGIRRVVFANYYRDNTGYHRLARMGVELQHGLVRSKA